MVESAKETKIASVFQRVWNITAISQIIVILINIRCGAVLSVSSSDSLQHQLNAVEAAKIRSELVGIFLPQEVNRELQIGRCLALLTYKSQLLHVLQEISRVLGLLLLVCYYNDVQSIWMLSGQKI